MVPALLLSFALVVMAFGVFIAWLAFRHRGERGAVGWGLAAGAFHIAVGATVLLAVVKPGATLYAAGTVAVLVVAKVVARRRMA
jgi:uncharacterized membrane protein HdeD (DUF308 family)